MPPHSPRGMRLTRDTAQVPITGLAFYYHHAATKAQHILAGEDGNLVIYAGDSTAQPKPLCRVRIFSAQPIHGISVGNPVVGEGTCSVVLLWGGSSVAVVSGAHIDSLLDDAGYDMRGKVARLQAPDWIYDGIFSPVDTSDAVLATAHNETVRLTFDPATNTAQLSKQVVSPSRPMLYVANVQWTNAGAEVLVAAGTVFGDVLVWKHAADKATKQQPQMLFSLSGHEGSIFGVCISPLLTLQSGQKVRLLASCSDDRTIRIWNITEQSPEGENGRAPPQVKTQTTVSDTGFRCAPIYEGDATPDQGLEDVSAIAMTMGHASRIWGVKFGVQYAGADTIVPDSGIVPIYSFGEDTTVQKWNLNLPAALEKQDKLKHRRTWALHDGKHLWSRAVLFKGEKMHIITGGADSKITYIQDDEAESTKSGMVTLDIEDLGPPGTSEQLGGRKRSSREMISRYDFIGHDKLLAGTNFGRLFICNFLGGQVTCSEIPIGEPVCEDMENVYVIRTIAHGACLLGTTTGKIYVFHPLKGLSLLTTVPGRVIEMNALTSVAEDYMGATEAIVHLHGTSSSWFLTFDNERGELLSKEEIHGLDARFVAISASRIGDLLAVGSRHGWLTLMRRDSEDKFQPVLDLPPHSKDAVTSITPLPASSEPSTNSPAYVLVTSREGKYRIYEMHINDQGNPSLELIHETTPPFGPWIEGAWFTKGQDGAPELILYGFRSKDFVMWNETRREELATIDCGGAHRTFRLSYDADDASRCRFAFTRTSKLSIYSQQGIAHRPVKLGIHGREIRTVSTSGRYVATGAEDASIRLWEYQPDKKKTGLQNQMQYMACIKAHVSGLQRVQWLDDEHLFSSAGNEEMYAWRMRRLDSAYSAIAVMCEGVFKDKSPVGDLRIMDFDVSRRYDGAVLATLAFSNSALKTYEYHEGRFTLICEGVYTGACLTQARHLLVDAANGEMRVLTAATDGHITLWESKAESDGGSTVQRYELVEAIKVHQNSIKSLDMTRLPGSGRYGVMTGGDDGGLGYTVVTSEESMRALPQGMVRRAHAAAVTGVVMLPDEKGCGSIKAISVSNDQWVKVWQMPDHHSREEGDKKARTEKTALLGEEYSGVADAGDVAALNLGQDGEGSLVQNREKVVVAGVGIEVWSLER